MHAHLRTGTEVLDGLRGIAILLVLTFHTWLFSWYTPELTVRGVDIPIDVIPRVGYFGVDLFFVISGFVLFFPYAVRAVTGIGTTHDPRTFAQRRLIKIVPSYAVALVFTVLSLESLHRPLALAPTFAQHALFINNFFDDQLGYANSVFWSLAIEAQFYIVFLPIAWAFGRRPVLAAAAMVSIAIAYRAHFSTHELLVEPLYRELPAFLDVFAAGMFAAYVVVWARAHIRDSIGSRSLFTVGAGLGVCCVWLLFVSANAVQYDRAGPERWDVLNRTSLAWAFAAFAATSCLAFPVWRAIVSNRVLVFFSLISYNLYLWHTLVMIWLWRGNVLPHALKDVHADSGWKALFIGVSWPFAIGIATAMSYFVERPFIARIVPQTFAFDWSRVRRTKPSSRPIASAGKRS